MTRHNSGIFICGYCRKRTPLADDELKGFITGIQEMTACEPVCECGHFSFASSIRFKAKVNVKDWRITGIRTI